MIHRALESLVSSDIDVKTGIEPAIEGTLFTHLFISPNANPKPENNPCKAQKSTLFTLPGESSI
jgi:hypothetical protein